MKSLQKLKKKKEGKFWRKCTNVKLNKKQSGEFDKYEFNSVWYRQGIYFSLE